MTDQPVKDITKELRDYLDNTVPLLAKPTEDGFLDEPPKPKFVLPIVSNASHMS